MPPIVTGSDMPESRTFAIISRKSAYFNDDDQVPGRVFIAVRQAPRCYYFARPGFGRVSACAATQLSLARYDDQALIAGIENAASQGIL